jgi:S-adenosylmethionine:tRNA ribosyltransferase-isomerase
MHLDDFDYNLPPELIAQKPCEPRDNSRLLIYSRETQETEIAHFYDILNYLKKGDVIVINTTRVMPARIFLKKENGTQIEILLHKLIEGNTFEVLLRPAKKLKVGDFVMIDASGGKPCKGILTHKDEAEGTAIMSFNRDPRPYGIMPIPPYIENQPNDPNRYQTVYADREGSAAAPTAGLHWTPELIARAKDKGIIFCEVLLHVGLGTFRPVKTENILDHKMHSEFYEISEQSARIINDAKQNGARVIACGTTVVRTLESVAKKHGKICAASGDTDIFIYPPFKFQVVDAIITNFHLPKSTLLMLVSAFIGREKVLELYDFAIQEKFRFFSFGDACLLL